MSLRILVVDDHPIFVLGLERLLASHGMEVCGTAGSLREGVELLRSKQPDVVVIDLSLPDGSGLHLLPILKESNPSLPAIIVSMHDEELFARRAMMAGAQGYLMKDAAPGQIVEALRQVARGEEVLSQRMEERVFRRGGNRESGTWLTRLSDRELEVFELLGRSQSTQTIAKRLGISVKTVETHQAKIKNKLALSSMAELIRAAAIWTDGGAALTSTSDRNHPEEEGGSF